MPLVTPWVAGTSGFSPVALTPFCTSDDVKARPALAGVTLTGPQTTAMPGFIEDATLIVGGYLDTIGYVPVPHGDPPAFADEVRVVTARLVARALTAPARPADLDTFNSSMGPMGHSAHVAADAIGGGAWLTKADKLILDSLVHRPGLSNIAMYDVEPCRPRGSVGGLWPR